MNYIPKIEYIELNSGTPKTVDFANPPEGDPFNEEFRVKSVSKRSTGGVKQTQFNYTLQRFSIEFLYQSETLKDQMEDFFNNHAARGGAFNYFPSNDEIDFVTMEMVSKVLKFNRPIPDSNNDFMYSFKFKTEKVI